MSKTFRPRTCRRLTLVALLAILLSLLACTRTKQAPDFSILTYQSGDVLNAQTLQFSSLLHGKPIVLNFWAGQCPPCRAEMPDFERMAQKYKGQVLILGIDVGPFTQLGSREDGRNLLKELNITYAAGTTDDSTVPARYGVLGMPTTVLIKPDGTIIRTSLGKLTGEQIEAAIQELLKAS